MLHGPHRRIVCAAKGAVMFVELVSVGNLFADNYFKPAKVQRQYVWGVDEGRIFLNDLIDAFRKDRHKKYFLGPVIFCEVVSGTNRVVEVFDGQQRLTTLTILLCVLSGLVDGPLRERLQSLTRERHRDEWRPRIDLQTQGGSLTSLVRGNRFQYHRFVSVDWRIKQISENLRSELGNLDEKTGFAQWLLRRVSLSVLWAEARDGLALFSNANTRGIRLSWVELAKAVVFDAVGGAGVTDREGEWYRVSRDADAEFEGLVRSIAAMWSSDEGEFGGVTAVEDRMASEEQGIVVNEFFSTLGAFRGTGQKLSMLRSQIGGQTHEDRYLIQLLALEFFHWKPFCYIGCRDLAGDAKLQFLRRLRDVAYTAHLIGWPAWPSRLDSAFSQALRNLITRGAAVFAREDLIEFNSAQLQAARGVLRTSLMDERFYRPIVKLVEAERAFRSALLNTQALFLGHVEHVLPRRSIAEWLQVIPDDTQRSELTHKLGNLCVLSKQDNEQAGNNSWQAKRAIYQRADRCFVGAREISAATVWNADAIEQRTDEIAQEVVSILNL